MEKKDFTFTPECFMQMFKECAEDIGEMSHNEADGPYVPDVYTYAHSISHAVGLVTYDGEMDLIFAPRIMEVIEALLDGKTFEYIRVSQRNHENYLMVCSLRNLYPLLCWGTSIRGAYLMPPYCAVPIETPISTLFSMAEEWMTKVLFNEQEQLKAAFRGLVMYYEKYVKEAALAAVAEGIKE